MIRPFWSPTESTCSRFVLVMVLLALGGCDPAVDAFQENEQHYSIFGYLDAAADTQFVRVERLRDNRPTDAPEQLEADVRLTNLDTETTVSLRDSLFQFYGDVAAHNFYTARDIVPGTSYRLVVEGPEGEVSRAQATVPQAPVTTVVSPVQDCFPSCDSPWLGPACESEDEGSNREVVLRVEGVDRLVAVKAIYDMTVPEGSWTFHHLERSVEGENGIQARAGYDEDWCHIPPPSNRDRTLKAIRMVVAAGGPDWPDFARLRSDAEQLPTVASNVEGGVGLFAGVVTDTLVVHR